MIFKSMYVKIGSTSNNVHNKVDKKWWGRDDIAKNKRTKFRTIGGRYRDMQHSIRTTGKEKLGEERMLLEISINHNHI